MMRMTTIAAVLLLLLAVSQVQAALLFSDSFTDGNVLTNDGIGGDWLAANQAAMGTAHTEFGGILTLANANDAWNVGGIKSIDSFAAGSTVRVTFTGATIVGTGTGILRGALSNTMGNSLIMLSDPAIAAAFPSSFHNANLFGIGVEINLASNGTSYAFNIRRGTTQGQETIDAAYIFDSSISINDPLIVDLTLDADGSYSVKFNKTYGGGNNAAIVGNIGKSLDDFRISLGSQMIQGTNFLSNFADVSVSTIPEPASLAFVACGALLVIRRRS